MALNPGRQFAQARNTQRNANVNAILNAVGQRMADNTGTWNTTCGAATVTLPAAATNIGSGALLIDLASCLVPTYLTAVPVDPSGGAAADTKYTILKDATTARITVAAPTAELSQVISVSR